MLDIVNVEVTYNTVIKALRGITVKAEQGKITALLGANGAGKTSLLRAITGLLSIHDGEIERGRIEFKGRDVAGVKPDELIRSGIAQVMERRRVLAELTVEENLLVGGYPRPKGHEKENLQAQYDRYPILYEKREQKAGYLSGGQQQMLAVGRALMAEPTLLLLDEPTLGLAPKIVEDIANTLVQLKTEGMTVLLVEQNAAVALEISDYGYVIENGRTVHEGTKESLLAHEDVREFYLGVAGSSSVNYREIKHYRRRKRWLS